MDKDIKGKHDKSLKAKNNRRSKANVNEFEDEMIREGGLKQGQLVVPFRSNTYRKAMNTMDTMKANVSPQENDLTKDQKYKGGGL